ncbi:MAG: hypothetical protein ACRC56_13580 [Bosea sp. (in: a-proteobacteria)]
MSIIKTIITAIRSWWHQPETLRAFRSDWPECCRDLDEMRRVLDDMQRECGRQGV